MQLMNENNQTIFTSNSKQNLVIEINRFFNSSSHKSTPEKDLIKRVNVNQFEQMQCIETRKSGQLLEIQNAIYKPVEAYLCQSHFHVKGRQINLHQIEKIKLYPNRISTKFYEIKLNVDQKEIYFAASSERTDAFNFPQHFQWFRHIILARLQREGIKGGEDVQYYQQLGQLCVKIEFIYIQGYIYKKSKYLKKWQKRYTVISSCGFYSFKNVTDSNYSYFIQPSSITQIWTRFDLLENNQYLIIKLIHGEREKAEFAIPLASLKNNYQCRNWLYQFYRIMQEGRGNKLC